MANQDIPRHLKHKPIVSVDYESVDQAAAAGDASFLSLGRAQWNNEDISAKVLRWTGEKWSRQSEELPLWRILDLANLIVAKITGQQSYLKESIVNNEDEDFINSFLSENMALYQSKIDELKSLLKISKGALPHIDNTPNIFSFATSELSQDAILAWLISWADDKYMQIDSDLCAVGKSFISLLTGMPEQDIHNVSVGRQWKNIDIWVEINADSFLTIEDKTGTTIHDDQLTRYKKIVEKEYNGSRSNLFFAYVKTDNEPASILNEVTKAGYKPISRTQIIGILNQYSGTNSLILDFKSHLQSIEDVTNSYKNLPVDQWDWYAWQGFYKELEKCIDVDSWGYVNNPSGGFVGMWWHWVENHEVSCYLQFEQEKLCIKIYYEGDANRSELREKYRTVLMDEAQKSNIPVERPARLGAGTYMTIGVLPKDYIFGSGKIFIPQIVEKLKGLENLVETTVECCKE